jgi:hypothetical protein
MPGFKSGENDTIDDQSDSNLESSEEEEEAVRRVVEQSSSDEERVKSEDSDQ